MSDDYPLCSECGHILPCACMPTLDAFLEGAMQSALVGFDVDRFVKASDIPPPPATVEPMASAFTFEDSPRVTAARGVLRDYLQDVELLSLRVGTIDDAGIKVALEAARKMLDLAAAEYALALQEQLKSLEVS